MAQGFPIDEESFLASIVEVLKERGCAREISILVAANVKTEQTSCDNWNGGTYGWGLILELDFRSYSALTEDERKSVTDTIRDVGREFFKALDNDGLERVLLVPAVISNKQWREDAKRYLAGEKINNQGRVRSDNLASKSCDGLLFRSQAEINLYVALKAIGVTFAPLPVFVRGGVNYQRLEPDFVLVKDGIIMVVEVDGDSYHSESPAKAHERLIPLDHEGAKIERVSADECKTPELARSCAQRLMRVLEKRKQQRI